MKMLEVVKSKKLVAIICVLMLGALPYRYRPGGKVQIVSEQEFRVQSEESGKVAYIIKQEVKDTPVKKGTLIARLRSDEIESNLEKNKKQIEAEKSRVDVIRKEIDSNISQLKTYEDQVEISNKRLKRWESLYTRGAVSLESLDQIKRENKTDKGNERTQKELVRTSQEKLDISKAEIESIEEQRNLLGLKYNKLKILMPFDGYVSNIALNKKQGLHLSTGDTLITVRSLDKAVYGRIQISESEASNIKMGSNAEIRLKNDWGQALFGKVREVGRVAEVSDTASNINTTTDSGQEVKSKSEQSGRVVNVIAEIQGKEGLKILPGMTGQAKIDGKWMPLGQVFIRSVTRYLNVEVWSWLP